MRHNPPPALNPPPVPPPAFSPPPAFNPPPAGGDIVMETIVWSTTVLNSDARLKKNIKVS